jgi:hypothetical protein
MKVKKSKVDNKISILVDEGYPRKQAVAIALAMEQKGKLQQGGQIPESNTSTIKPKEANAQDFIDYINATRVPEGVDFDFRNVMNMIAHHESMGTMDPKLKQRGGGPGRGLYQIEPARFETMKTRVRKVSEILGYSVPDFINDESLKVDDLTREQQDLLMVADMIQGPHKNPDLVSGKMSLQDYWANYHWAGKSKDRADRIRAFNESMTTYDGPPLFGGGDKLPDVDSAFFGFFPTQQELDSAGVSLTRKPTTISPVPKF